MAFLIPLAAFVGLCVAIRIIRDRRAIRARIARRIAEIAKER